MLHSLRTIVELKGVQARRPVNSWVTRADLNDVIPVHSLHVLEEKNRQATPVIN